MAACRTENELLNKTLTGLRSTSKGQLNYDPDWPIHAETLNELSCSFESFLNGSIVDLNSSLVTLSSEENDNNTSSGNEVESSLDAELNDVTTKTNPPLGISRNFDIENERNIQQYHDDCRGNTEQRKAERARILERRSENLQNDVEETVKRKEEHLVEQRRQFENEIGEMQRENAEMLRQRKIQLDREAMEHKKRQDKILAMSLTEESLLAREKEERIIALAKMKENIESRCHHILRIIPVIHKKFIDCKNISFVDAKLRENITLALNSISEKAKSINTKYEACNNLSDAKYCLEVINNLISAALSIERKVDGNIKLAEEKAVDILKKKEEEQIKIEMMKREQQKQAEEQKKLEDKKLLHRATEPPSEEKLPTVARQSTIKGNLKPPMQKFVEFISDKTLTEYTELQERLNTVEASFKEFISDPKHTKYKFDLQKAVNTPINALSAHSPSQLNDKIHRLVTLLRGNNVEVGSRRVNCKSHPSALAFCQDLVAKKLVMQGAQQVSFNPESAFLYAAVIVGIWKEFPDVGMLILAHFHQSFPYLVPYYMPQVEEQSSNDYYKALGYSVSNDKIEDDNHFLKKFSGTVQLYAAVVTSKGAATPNHPYGIEHGWTWLARTLNLKPHPSVTATMLYEFIKVAGHLLMEKYRKQFQKLLLVLFKDYVPAIDKVTPPEKKGPLQRFKVFLDECVKTQKIAVPKGYLTERWWHSGHF